MVGPTRTREKRISDRAYIADAYVKGVPQREMAETLGVSVSQIEYDLARLRDKWIESTKANYSTVKVAQLQKLDRMEREAWDAWDRSKEPKKKKGIKVGGEVSKSPNKDAEFTATQAAERTTAEETRDGDPRYLQVVGSCIERRCKILGLDAAEKHTFLTGPDADVSTLTDEQCTLRIAELIAEAEAIRMGRTLGPGPAETSQEITEATFTDIPR